ncbi:hypothetical protein BHYA_0663g00030 [Botrytis hyacinthi]|uniref:Uncharacterized protein n=1 Tax=Botrytis hyacinthi TaxID=278943 RepID=A0A4Z1G7S6_9HELO|nr:hypothetical protein BHYA_0663g00030 [Botrytis hyacinthi]
MSSLPRLESLAEFATGPDLITPLEKEEWSWQQKHANAGKDSAAPIDADLFIYRSDKERESTCSYGSDKGVSCNSASTVARKSIDNILEERLEDSNEANLCKENTDNEWPRARNVLNRDS